VLSELVHASRASLLVGIGTGLFATALGLVVGVVAGYYGGVLDEILMAVTDVTLMLPRIPVVISSFRSAMSYGMVLNMGGDATFCALRIPLVASPRWRSSTGRGSRALLTLRYSRSSTIWPPSWATSGMSAASSP
jgi:ABC-type spermidine/putrescine transport system permease subunit II